MVYDGTNLTVYRNGNSGPNGGIASQAVTAPLGGYAGYQDGILIGSELAQPGNRTWNGMLDDVAVFAGALTKNQVATVTDLAGDPDITFTGTITVTRPFSPNSVTVSPKAFVEDADARWKVTPNPSKLTFNGSGSQPFTIVVSAPANLSAGATFDVVFNATATGLLYYNTVSTVGYIEVLQYYKLGQYASSEVIHIKQDDSRTLNFTVQNRGNGEDSVAIVLGNEAELELPSVQTYAKRLAATATAARGVL